MGSHVLPALTDDPDELDRPWWLRLLRHSTDLALAGYSLVVGAVTLIQAITIGHFGHTVLDHLPLALAGIVAGTVALGGLIALIGTVIRIENLKLELGLETAGWFIIHIGWVAYIAGAFGYSDLTPRVAAMGVIALGAAAKVVALILHQRILRRRQVRVEKVNDLISRIEGDND